VPEPEEPVEPVAAQGPRRSPARWLPWALALVFLATAIVMTIVAASLNRDLDEAETGDREVASVAGRFAEALFTYDHRDVATTRERVLSMSTGGFRDEYEEAFEGGIDVFIEETEATSEVTVKEVLVGAIEGGTATAVVIIDTSADGAGGARNLRNLYLRLDMVRVEGEWKVASVTYPETAPPEPAAPPATTAP
jgi:hypothetical protein